MLAKSGANYHSFFSFASTFLSLFNHNLHFVNRSLSIANIWTFHCRRSTGVINVCCISHLLGFHS